MYQFSAPSLSRDINLELSAILYNNNINVITNNVINTSEINRFIQLSDKIKVICEVSGILKDLTPAEIDAFDEAVKRRQINMKII